MLYDSICCRQNDPGLLDGAYTVYTSAELQMLRNADPGVVLPGIDTPEGNPLPVASLTLASQITTSRSAPYYYDPVNNRVCVTQVEAQAKRAAADQPVKVSCRPPRLDIFRGPRSEADASSIDVDESDCARSL